MQLRQPKYGCSNPNVFTVYDDDDDFTISTIDIIAWSETVHVTCSLDIDTQVTFIL